MFRTFAIFAVWAVTTAACGQVSTSQQSGAMLTAKQPTPPIVWLLVPKTGSDQLKVGSGAEWTQFVLAGDYTLLAVNAGGQVAQQAVTIGGTPGPGPGPQPNPQPGPTPNPTPGKISAALVCDPSGIGTETPQQVAARVTPAAAAYMDSKGYRWRQLVGTPLDATGKAAASEAFFVSQAAKLGKYPALIVAQSGASTPLLAAQINDPATLLSTLQRYGGLSEVQPRAPAFIDVERLQVDVPAPAGIRMGLIPSRKIDAFQFAKPEAAGIPDIPESQWATFYAQQPPTILSQWVWDVMDQDGLGACAAFAATGAVEVAEAMAGLPRKPLAAFALYSLVAYPRDSGSGLDENANTVATVGIPEIEFNQKFAGQGGWSNSGGWPAGWQSNAARHKCQVLDLSGNSTSEAWHNLVVMLLRGIPCTIGVDWPGGHSILAVAPVFQNGQATGILIVNSWGADWNGDGRTIRSKANVVNGIGTFGGPFAYVVPTFPQEAKAEPKPAAVAPPCPTGTCPWVTPKQSQSEFWRNRQGMDAAVSLSLSP